MGTPTEPPQTSILDRKQFLIIFGCDRSGTSWLQSLIGAHPDVATTVQLSLFHGYIGPWIDQWKMEAAYLKDPKSWNQGLPVVWSEQEFFQFLRNFISSVYERVEIKNTQASHVLDKHPGYRLYIDEVMRFIPNAKMMHVIRDGRDVASSLVAAKQQLGWGYENVADAAAAWKNAVEISRTAQKYSDNYLEVRYEDLLEHGEQTLTSVFEFCGLPQTKQQVSEIIESKTFEKMKSKKMSSDPNVEAPAGHYRFGKAGRWKSAYSPAECYDFELAAGRLLRDLGYAENGWWHETASGRFRTKIAHEFNTVRRRIQQGFLALRGR